MEIRPIATIHTQFHEKFGIPRQSGIVDCQGMIVFEEEFRNPEALRGLDGFSHLWLLWEFSENVRAGFSPTVRPPRLGGNKRMGVFATRSPFRPNPIGLSCVKLLEIRKTQDEGTVLVVAGADLMDGTPIFDVKPYLPYTDSHPDATGGFADPVKGDKLTVTIPDALREKIAEEDYGILLGLLAHDPRPSYHDDPERVYFMDYGRYSVAFRVEKSLLTVTEIHVSAN